MMRRGVRRQAGRQAQILNQIVEYFSNENIPVILKRPRNCIKKNY